MSAGSYFVCILASRHHAALALDAGAAGGGDAFCGMSKPQLRPSALRPGLPAAKAGLEAVMQTTRRAAAAISISSLMDHAGGSIDRHQQQIRVSPYAPGYPERPIPCIILRQRSAWPRQRWFRPGRKTRKGEWCSRDQKVTALQDSSFQPN